MSDEWSSAMCWSSISFGNFMIKKWVEFNVTSFGTLKTREMFNLLPLINKSATIEFNLLSLILQLSNH